jgi:hypothetical protein
MFPSFFLLVVLLSLHPLICTCRLRKEAWLHGKVFYCQVLPTVFSSKIKRKGIMPCHKWWFSRACHLSLMANKWWVNVLFVLLRFMDSSKLKRHYLAHTGQNDFICPRHVVRYDFSVLYCIFFAFNSNCATYNFIYGCSSIWWCRTK